MSETFTTNQATIVASKFKKITWLFEVQDLYGNVFCWSTKNTTYGNVSLTGVDKSEIEGQTTPLTSVPKFRSYISVAAKAIAGALIQYKHRIVEFDGIEMMRSKQDMNIIAPNDLRFTVSNADGSLIPTNFNGGQVYVALLISNGSMERIIRRWRFKIKQVENGYKRFRVVCEDWIQEYLRGLYPKTRLVRDIFSSSDVGPNDNVCVPVPFGTAYVPLRSVYIANTVSLTTANVKAVASASGQRCYIQSTANVNFKSSGFETGRYVTISGFANAENNGTFYLYFVTASRLELSEGAGLIDETAPGNITLTEGARHYVLGDPAYTYNISEVRSPRAWGRKSTWDSPVNAKHAIWGGTVSWDTTNEWNYQYTFEQSTKSDGVTNWRVFQPLIADVDLDGTGDSCGVWRQGEIFLDMPCKFSRSDTASKTNPADVISWILRDMGIANKNIAQATFDAAKAVFASWSLTWNGALWLKERRATILSRLLAMCASQLLIGEGVELHVLSKTSKKTITTAEIIRQGYIGQGTFEYLDISHQHLHDSAYVGWQESGEAQDLMVKTLVPATGTSKLVPANTVIDMPWVQNSQRVQRLATLYFQRSLLKKAQVNFVAKSTCLALNPGDVVTIDDTIYGASVADDETGATWGTTVHGLSLANGAAFFAASGVDLSGYAGTEGTSTPYKIELYDSTGKVAKGFIGAADAAESLGSELVTNGTFAANVDNWNNHGTSPYDTFEHDGVGALHAVTDGSALAIISSDDNIATVTGKLYKVTFDVAVSSGVGPKVALQATSGGTTRLDLNSVDNTWQTAQSHATGSYAYYYTATATENIVFSIWNSATQTGNFTLDNVSIKEVTHVGATGVHIVSAMNGSTRNWGSIQSGFNYNGTSYTFNIISTYDAIIDNMRINKDCSIQISATRLSCDIDDYGDLSPSAITLNDDDTSKQWEQVLGGPMTDEDLTRGTFEVMGKPYLVVGKNTNFAQFTDIQKAVNALAESRHLGIYICNGNYYLPDSIYLGKRNIEIIGESKDGVNLYTSPGKYCFFMIDPAVYSFDSFTVRSRNAATSSGVTFQIYSMLAAKSITIANVRFFLNDSRSASGVYDIGIRAAQSPTEGLIVKNCYFDRGMGIQFIYVDGFTISDNVFNDNPVYAVQLGTDTTNGCTNGSISSNYITDFWTDGIYTSDSGYISITGNNLIAKNVTHSQTSRGIFCGYSTGQVVVASNTVEIVTGRSASIYGIHAYDVPNSSYNNNVIKVTGLALATGIRVETSDSIISGNSIVFNGGGVANHGIFIGVVPVKGTARNIINNNVIDGINNTAADYGIYLENGVANNQGSDNVTYQVGTSVYDPGSPGTGNSVTAKDV